MFNLELINQKTSEELLLGVSSVVNSPLEHLEFSKFIDDRSIAISYLESEEVNSRDNIYINDLSWKVPRNNPNFLKRNSEREIEGNAFYSPYSNVELTNKTYINIEGREEPLYYKHFRPVKEAKIHYIESGDEFVVDTGFNIIKDWIYTNYKNFYNPETGSYRIYFVSGVDESGNQINDLLNIIPAIKEASWEDIDLESGDLIGDVYTREEQEGGYYFQVNFDEIDSCNNAKAKIFVRGSNENLIKLIKPEAFSLDNSWILRVQNGWVLDKKKYWLPEFENQPFDPEFGLIKFHNKTCNLVKRNIIKLPVNKIKVKIEDEIHLSIFIYDELENLIKCSTTETRKIGTKYSNTNIRFDGDIDSWDEFNGFVELKFDVNSSQIIKADFCYKTDTLIYSNISVNPLENKNMIYNKYYFYLLSNAQRGSRSVHHLLLDEDGRILECSESSKALKTEFGFNPNTVIGMNIRNFKELYCYGYENEHQYMELGEVSLEEDFYLDEINEVEVKEATYTNSNNYEEMLNRQWKVLQSKHGYGDLGQVVQKNNIVYLEVPIDLLQTMGGDYTSEELESLLRRRLPHGIDIVIDYTYPKPSIVIDNSTEGELVLNISWEGIGTYIISRKEEGASGFSEIIELHSDEEETLSVSDTEIEAGKVYYYKCRFENYPDGNIYGAVAIWVLYLKRMMEQY